MDVFLAVAGLLLLAIILWDVFEVVILPRRVTRRIRLARMYYKWTWSPWRGITRRVSRQAPGTANPESGATGTAGFKSANTAWA